MNRTALKPDHGQALVLMALMMVGLIAFVGLAVDGGMAYAQRREAQNAADSSAVAGTYELRVQHRTLTYSQSRLRAAILRAAQAHNVPDSNGNPSDTVNTNVVAYFTDTAGNRLADPLAPTVPCEIAVSCTRIPDGAWGIDVEIDKPFDSYFIGVIGLDELVVGADASALTHPGASNWANEQWALFGTNYGMCPNNDLKVSGQSSNPFLINGNVHSNGELSLNGVTMPETTTRSYVTSCDSNTGLCATARQIVRYPHLETGSLWEYSTGLVNVNTNTTPSWTVMTGAEASTRNPDRTSVVIGSHANPFTWINGDLNVGQNHSITMYGLIYVTGNVNIQGAATATLPPAGWTPPAGTCGASQSNLGRFTIVAQGQVELSPSNGTLAAAPYINADYDALAENTLIVFSAHRHCGNDAIHARGSSFEVWGSMASPWGRINMSDSEIRVHGALIGDSMSIATSTGSIDYEAACFPEQPDYIEMIR